VFSLPFYRWHIDGDQSIAYRLCRASTGLGVPARRIEKASDIAFAIEASIANGRANLIDIGISAS
jgi:hypothetical protein